MRYSEAEQCQLLRSLCSTTYLRPAAAMEVKKCHSRPAVFALHPQLSHLILSFESLALRTKHSKP